MTKHDGKEKKIRSPMAVAIVKLLTHFPLVVLQDYVRRTLDDEIMTHAT